MRRFGFTMIELLVVIAIIAILAAIIFPAALNAKDAAYRSSDMSHLNELRTALQLYKVDQGAYPPELFGYVETYATGAQAGQTIPPDQIQAYLFPKRVSSLSTFTPAYDHTQPNTVTVGGDTNPGTVVPNVSGNCVGSAANNKPPATCVYWPGVPPTSPACNLQAYGDTQPVLLDPSGQTSGSPVPKFYAVDGYDVAPEQDSAGKTRYEIHYALYWTGYGLGTSICTGAYTSPPGSSGDDPRQLGYNNPPDNSVITWDTYFRNYVNHEPESIKRDVVLFIGGNAKMYDSRAVQENTWNTSP